MAKQKDLERVNSLKRKTSPLVTSVSDLAKSKELIQAIRITEILPPKYHDRKHYSQDSIEELAKNIKANKGQKLLQPIIVRQVEGGYERIVGFRRIEAYKFLGKEKIEAIVLTNITEEEAILMMLSENIQREDPSIFDQTVGIMNYLSVSQNVSIDEIKQMLYRFRNMDSKVITATEEDIAKREIIELTTQKLGKISVATMVNRLKMFSLHKEILTALSRGEITYSIALEIDKQKDEEKMRMLLEAAKNKDISVREIKTFFPKEKTASATKCKDPLKFEIKEEEGGAIFSFQDISKSELKKIKNYIENLRKV